MIRNIPSNISAALASGLLLTGTFPNFDLSWMAWFALVPLFFATIQSAPGNSFRLGFICGITHYLTLMYWLAHTMTSYGGLPYFVAIPILFLLTAYLSLFPAILTWILAICRPAPLVGLLLIPSLWAGLEFIRSFFLTGFPWELLGYSQYRLLPLIQIADITGPYGITFIIVAINTALSMAVACSLKKKWYVHQISAKMVAFALVSCAIASGIIWIYGTNRIHSVDTAMEKSPKRTIAAIQGNIPQDVKWDPHFQKSTINRYVELSNQVQTVQPDLIVWPESATPFYLYNHPVLTKMVVAGIQDAGTDFLIGSPSFEGQNENTRFYNSAYLIGPSGRSKEKYDKAHLVPFGEYVPFKKYLPFLGKIVAHVGDFHAGPTGRTIPWNDQHLGILICYELIFPELGRKQVQNGATLLINLTNDAWYGRTSAPHQHFSTAVFRAVETKRALVRAANTGISGFIDPLGRIQQKSPLFKPAAIHQSIHLMTLKTLYTRIGDLFATICLVLAGILIIYSFLIKRKSASIPSKEGSEKKTA